ncbi:hypothetical protein BS78_10G004900 [Paspalum vaginatum]|nr:hypothetical protein BS78_10G004900 [Paspalum vaginatum]
MLLSETRQDQGGDMKDRREGLFSSCISLISGHLTQCMRNARGHTLGLLFLPTGGHWHRSFLTSPPLNPQLPAGLPLKTSVDVFIHCIIIIILQAGTPSRKKKACSSSCTSN